MTTVANGLWTSAPPEVALEGARILKGILERRKSNLRQDTQNLFPNDKESSGEAKSSSSYDVLTEMMGFAAYVNMVDESKGSGLIDSVKALMRKYR